MCLSSTTTTGPHRGYLCLRHPYACDPEHYRILALWPTFCPANATADRPHVVVCTGGRCFLLPMACHPFLHELYQGRAPAPVPRPPSLSSSRVLAPLQVVFVREGVAVWPSRSERILGRLSLVKQCHVMFLAWLPYSRGTLQPDGTFRVTAAAATGTSTAAAGRRGGGGGGGARSRGMAAGKGKGKGGAQAARREGPGGGGGGSAQGQGPAAAGQAPGDVPAQQGKGRLLGVMGYAFALCRVRRCSHQIVHCFAVQT